MAGNGLLTVLLGTFTLVLLVLAPYLLVGDSWMTFVSGREIWEHGFVTRDALTVIGQGREWIDQQWLAQLLFFGAHSLGGLRLALFLDVALVASAFAVAATAARRRASERSVLIVTVLAIVAAPWSWQIRAQVPALLLFATTVAVLCATQRASPSRRPLLLLPVLVLWANVHGSVVLGALLVMAAGALDLLRRRGPAWVPGLLVVVAPLTVLASPYAAGLPGYYRLLLFESEFDELVTEWAPTRPDGSTAVFFVLAILTVGVACLRFRTLTPFEAVALALTLYVAIDAIRGVIWFALTAAIVMPRLLDAATGWRQAAPRRALNVLVGSACVAGVAVFALVQGTRPTGWFERDWPLEALPAIAAATERPSARVYTSGHFADWALWHQPSLRGRVAWDVRLELYTRAEIVAGSRFTYMEPGWRRELAGYDVVLVHRVRAPRQAAALVAEGATEHYRSSVISVLSTARD